MSDTITQINAGQELANWAVQVTGMLVKDVQALTEEVFAKTYGGVTRSAADVTAETTRSLIDATDRVNGGSGTDVEGTPFGTIAEATTALTDAAAGLAEALQSNADSLSETTTARWGQEMSRYQYCNIMVNHVWYHDGQICYIQELEGDDKNHWM